MFSSPLSIRPPFLSLPSQQPSPLDSITAIKQGRKPVSVLLLQFSMAQGHGSNISFPCLLSRGWRRRENSGRCHVRPCDWLLYLCTERIGQADWLALKHSWWLGFASFILRWPLSVWLTGGTYSFDLLICFSKKRAQYVCPRMKYYTITWIYFSSALCPGDSFLTRSIVALQVIQSKHLGSSDTFLTFIQRPQTYFYNCFPPALIHQPGY